MTKKIFPLLKVLTYILWVPFIITISFEMITFSDWIYEFNWERNNISYKTNLNKDQLNSASDQIKDYFKNDQEKIKISVVQSGRTILNLFNQREIDHMIDVKNLVKTTLLFEKISLFFIFFIIIVVILSSSIFNNNNIITLNKYSYSRLLPSIIDSNSI